MARKLTRLGETPGDGPIAFGTEGVSGSSGDAYASITDGANSANASGADTFKLRSANNILDILVADDDVTHGDNALYTITQANIDHGSIGGLGDDDHSAYVLAEPSSTDNRIVRWDGTGGRSIQTSGVSISDANIISGVSRITFADTTTIDGNDMAVVGDYDVVATSGYFNVLSQTFQVSTGAGGDITLNPGAGGDVILPDVATGYVTSTSGALGSVTEIPLADLDLAGIDGTGLTLSGDVLSVVPGEIDHDALLNFVANEHIDHSSVEIETTNQSGLSGGGDITSTVGLQLDISRLVAMISPMAADDLVAIYDDSATTTKKTAFPNFMNEGSIYIDHDDTIGFVANEHIDHTSVEIATAAGSGLANGGTIAATRNLVVDINGLTADGSPDPAADYVMTWDASASARKKVLLEDIGSGGSGPHTLLDGSVHTDTAADTVSRGSLIYGNATPLWDELVIGAASRLLRSDGTDVSWAQVVLTTDVTGILPVPNGGTGLSTITSDRLVTGTGTSAMTVTDAEYVSGVFERQAAGNFVFRAASGSATVFGIDDEGNLEVGPATGTTPERAMVPAIDFATRPFNIGSSSLRFGEGWFARSINMDADGDGTDGVSTWGADQDAKAWWNNTDSVLDITPALRVDNIKIDGSTISGSGTNISITLTPSGTGTILASSDVRLGADSRKIVFGTGLDDAIYHDGTNLFLDAANSIKVDQDFKILADNKDLVFGADEDIRAYWNGTNLVLESLANTCNLVFQTSTTVDDPLALRWEEGAENISVWEVNSGSYITTFTNLDVISFRPLKSRAGSATSGATMNVAGVFSAPTTSTATSSTTETTITTTTLPANAFAGDSPSSHFIASGPITGSIRTKRWRLKVDGTTILDTGALGIFSADSNWFIDLRIWKTSSTGYKYMASFRATLDADKTLLEYLEDYGTGTVTNWTSDRVVSVTCQIGTTGGADVSGEVALLAFEGTTNT